MGIGDDSNFRLAQAAFLSKSLKAKVIEGVSEEQANNVYAGYCESFLMLLAVRYPEVRKEMEERIVYKDFNA
jgi:hypothetical protein